MARTSNQFRDQWQNRKWWAVFSAQFLAAKVGRVRTFRRIDNKIFPLHPKDVLCLNVHPRSFCVRDSVYPTVQSFLANMDDMDTWMELPVVTKRPAEGDPSTRGKPAPKGQYGGKGKASKNSSSTGSGDKLTDMALLNIDARLRTVEDILEDALDTPLDLPEIEMSIKVGPAYNEVRLEKGRGVKLGSPHTFVFSAFIKTVAQNSDCPAELKQMIITFMKNYSTASMIRSVVPFCTAHKQHGKNRAVFKVHVSSDIRPL